MKRKILERPARLGNVFGFGDADNDEYPTSMEDDRFSPAASSVVQEPERALRCREKGCALAEAGCMSDALKFFQEGLLFSPQDELLLELSAQMYLQLDRPMAAVKSAEEAVVLASTWADGHLTLARAQRELGEVESSIQSYQRVLELDITHTDAQTELEEMQVILTRILAKKQTLLEAVQTSATAEEAEANTAILNLASRANS